ncbi:MAG: hypothetical protein ABH950_00625 [Candidatus Altiarchaeota archaeon]
MAATNFNPPVRRAENSLKIFGLTTLVSLITYVIFGFELLLWRGVAFGAALAIGYFLLHPQIRGVRKGDMVMANIWREIDTPQINESYIETAPTVALEDGKANQRIRVQLWDGSQGIVHLTSCGILTLAEGRLVEAEIPKTSPKFTDYAWFK